MDMQLGLTQQIVTECRRRGLSVQSTAYVLATAYWETARTMQPVREAYYLGAKAPAYRERLRYFPYYGRGLVQLTWQRNYLHAGQKLGADLVTNPDLALDPGYSVQILVLGMIEGWFTGKKLSDYITAAKADYVGARKIINGTDKAAEIAAIACDYERAITTLPANRPGIPDSSPLAAFFSAIMALFRRK